MKKIVVVGYGGHAKSVMDCIERQGNFTIAGYTDFQQNVSKYEYLGTDDNLKQIFESGIHYAAIGVGYMGKGNIRERIYTQLKSIGFELPIIIDPSAVISNTAIIEEGSFIGKLAVINAEANIGKATIINTKALVEHECVVGAFCHIAVGAVLCGQVIVHDKAFVGANATVIQCRTVNNNCIVPAGAVIR